MAKNAIDAYVDKKINAFSKKAAKDLDMALNSTMDVLYKEAINLYDSYIEQFYRYKTQSYIRHGEGHVGTSMGTNLYRGQQIKLTRGSNPKLYISFSAADMEGGYQYATPDGILTRVIEGIRFEHPKYKGLTMRWSGSYTSPYFKTHGTLRHAFDEFESNFVNIARPIAMSKWHKLRSWR